MTRPTNWDEVHANLRDAVDLVGFVASDHWDEPDFRDDVSAALDNVQAALTACFKALDDAAEDGK